MDDTPRNERNATPDPTRSTASTPPTTAARKERGRPALWGALAILIAFSAGFLWQYVEARTVRSDLAAVERELEMERLRVHLGQAALSAQSGDFEMARQQMSTFFKQLQESAGAMSPEVRTIADDYLNMRDEVITGLSRSNPEYAAILFGMHQRLSAAIDRSLDGADATEDGEAEMEGE